jgi:hypothetical protein
MLTEGKHLYVISTYLTTLLSEIFRGVYPELVEGLKMTMNHNMNLYGLHRSAMPCSTQRALSPATCDLHLEQEP